jgi:hypothetical protein
MAGAEIRRCSSVNGSTATALRRQLGDVVAARGG